jgi:uncharacterized protein (DUF2267 family)
MEEKDKGGSETRKIIMTYYVNFDQYAQKGNQFVKNLAQELGHPDEVGRTGILLRAVLHTIRDRITISESLNFMAQLPVFVKALYADDWKYQEKPLRLDKEDFLKQVEKHQAQYGESEFSWEKSTEELVKIVIRQLRNFVSRENLKMLRPSCPKSWKKCFRLHNQDGLCAQAAISFFLHSLFY